jgi:hypothetical protein
VSITILFFLAPIGVIVAWWLSRQRLMAKPWLDVSAIGEVPDTGASSSPAATIGLGVFLAVVSSLFALFISAYFMRMQVADWVQLPAPKLLWFNTGVLILSSVALQYAQVAARRGRIQDVGDGLKVWRGFEVKPGALERAAVRSLLAFSACPLARLIQSPDAVGGRFRTSSVAGW